MSEIAQIGRRDVAAFNPSAVLGNQAKLDAIIEYAKKIKDWPLFVEAVDAKLDEWQEFVAWWDEEVGVNHGGDRSVKSADRGTWSFGEAEKLTLISNQRASRWRKALGIREEYRKKILDKGRIVMGLDDADSRLVQQSLSNEHYTPVKYIDAARQVMGGIDLDPASCAQANDVVGATEFFDQSANGLQQNWHGRVWLNPPYGDLPGLFITKLTTELSAKRVSSAIVLVNAHCTDTTWFRPLWDSVLCFTDHRINFYGDDTRSGSTHGSVFAYFGYSRRAFASAFSQFGAVVARFADDD